MTKLVKLLRASQLVKQVRDTFVETIEYYKIHVSDATLKLIRLFLTMLTLSHWGSCLMFILLKAYDYPAESWAARWDIVEAETGAPVYGVLHCYSWGIYKTAARVRGADPADERLHAGLRLPTELRDRIRDYYYQRWKEGSIFDETLILERLSPELCHEIMRYKTRDLVKKVPALRNATTMFMKELVSSLQPSVAPEGDVVVHEGETGESLFFVDAGLAEILAKAVGDQVVKLIADGCFFGECSLVLKCRCTATVRAKTVLSCYAVGDEDLDEILEDHADMREYLGAARSARDDGARTTPLFLSLAAKRRQKLLEGEHRGIRHSLVRAYGRASAVFAGGQPASTARPSSRRREPKGGGGRQSKVVVVGASGASTRSGTTTTTAAPRPPSRPPRREPAADQARDGEPAAGKVTLPAIGEAASVRTLDDGVVQLE
ncbi:voltage-gated potassium channel [Aureococcus anophagefferens]|nr:voltage-gated potassium channel [Aureococcus anophagefferens]